MKSLLPRRTPIGLDLGAHSIKAVQLVRRGTAWQAIAATCLPRTNPGSELARADLERLLDVLRRQGFIGRRVVAALAPEKMMSGVLELPARAPGMPMEQIAQAEFCRINKLEAAEVVMSHWELPASARANRATYAMAVGCRANDADAFLDLVESAGLEVEALTSCGWATAQACLKLSDSPQHMTAILDIGWSAGTLSILKSGAIIYERRMCEAGLGALIQTMVGECGVTRGDVEYILQRTGMAQSEAAGDNTELDNQCRSRTAGHFAKTTEELRQACTYAAHQYPDSEIPALWLAGGGSRIAGLEAFLGQTLQMPVKIAQASEVVQCPASLVKTMNGSMLAASGLAQFDAK
jgi:Tfp pilus assembly PilM family ATPase